MGNATVVERNDEARKQIAIVKWCIKQDPLYYCKGSIERGELEDKAKEALGYAV